MIVKTHEQMVADGFEQIKQDPVTETTLYRKVSWRTESPHRPGYFRTYYLYAVTHGGIKMAETHSRQDALTHYAICRSLPVETA